LPPACASRDESNAQSETHQFRIGDQPGPSVYIYIPDVSLDKTDRRYLTKVVIIPRMTYQCMAPPRRLAQELALHQRPRRHPGSPLKRKDSLLWNSFNLHLGLFFVVLEMGTDDQ
jgi:hypothetical protein